MTNRNDDWDGKNCLFCGEGCQSTGIDSIRINCGACGRYRISDIAVVDYFQGPDALSVQHRVNLGYHTQRIRNENLKAVPIWVTSSDAVLRYQQAIAADPTSYPTYPVLVAVNEVMGEPTDHSKKPYNLLQSFANRLSHNAAYGFFSSTSTDRIAARICDKIELSTLIQFLEKRQLVRYVEPTGVAGPRPNDPYRYNLQITVEGWEHIYKENEGLKSVTALIAMQFSWPDSDVLKTEVLEAIRTACIDLGYQANIVSQNHTGNITDKIVSEIRRSRFVIAELTYNNRGVYYESGYARALGRNVFHLVHEDHVNGDDLEGKKLHFDIQQIQYRKWKTPTELKETLRDWIEATEGRAGENS